MFKDRKDAGKKLAEKIKERVSDGNLVILGLPRGGVPVAYQVARELQAPLDVFIVRKLGLPSHPELAMGAIATGGVRVLNDDVVNRMNISEGVIERVAEEEREKLQHREEIYRGARPRLELEGKTVVVVDDGLATGATMKAAVDALHQLGPGKIIVAVPTAPPRTCEEFDGRVDELLCLTTPSTFMGVGGSYRDFEQTSNQEVTELLEKARQWSEP